MMEKILKHALECLEKARSCSDPAVWIHLATEAELERDVRRLVAWNGMGNPLPLSGLVFAVKDNIDVAHWPTTAACPAFATTARQDSTVVARLRAAGAIPLGKTNLDQFATGLVGTRSPYGAPCNALSPDHISGGSSSGSAVALALGHVDFALGTDTAGSGRIPAAFQNITGLKPSRGLWSTTGVVPACKSLDCVSVFTLDTALARKVWDAVQDTDPSDPYSRPLPGDAPMTVPAHPVLGIPAILPFDLDPLWIPLWEEAKEKARAKGATLVEIDFTPFEKAAQLLYEGPWTAERWEAVGTFVKANPTEIHPITRRILETGEKRTASELFASLHELERLCRLTDSVFSGIDALMLPTASHLPTRNEVEDDPVGVNSGLGRGTNFCNLLDLSALALPAGMDERGLPFGITLFAPAFHDRKLLAMGDRWTGNPAPAPVSDRVRLAVAGLHLSGEPLNHELVSRGGVLKSVTRTSSAYRAYRIVRGERRFPGLVRTGDGAPIEVEIWSLPPEGAGSFLASCVRPPLCLGTVELEDGSTVMGFLCEDHGILGMEDITAHGGWRSAIASPVPAI
ncbi:MAG: allophanate hydrolase [Fibrobacterota bacterium]|jgi:allophanate hydrolase